jgi:hypothetical protein
MAQKGRAEHQIQRTRKGFCLMTEQPYHPVGCARAGTSFLTE